jgi:hypothetical protein
MFPIKSNWWEEPKLGTRSSAGIKVYNLCGFEESHRNSRPIMPLVAAAARSICAATAPKPYCGTTLAFTGKNRFRTAELARRFASALSSRRTCAMEN